MQSLKKIIGKIGRRYGGRPFQVVRKWYYDFLSFAGQCRETYYLSRGRYAPGHRDERFYSRNYPSGRAKSEGGNRVQPKVIMMCDGKLFHGGPTDRLRGILTTYREARRRGMPFYIYWRSPFRLEDYLEPAGFDWRIEDDELKYTAEEAFPLIIEDENNLQSGMRMRAGLKQRKEQIHVYSNADNGIGGYGELYKEVFKPSPALERNVDKHLSEIGAPYWAFTFRFLNLLGDFREWQRTTLEGEERDEFVERVKGEMLRIMEEMPAGYRALVTSDSVSFLDAVKEIDERIYVVPGDVKNVDLTKEEHREAWMKTFTDQQLLMRAERVYLMRTGRMYKSGFPRFAAEVGGVEFVDHKF